MPIIEGRVEPGRELRALLLSLPALAVPVLAAFFFPESLSDYEALLWLLALIPAFLLAYHRGWQGVATALALGMALISVTYAITRALGAAIPELLLGVVVAYVAISLGIGWLTEGLMRARQEEAADGLALRDPLTDLPNRRQAEAHLELELAAAERGRAVAVVLFDLDRFAQFNAENGRAAGDGVLRSFGRLLRQNTRRMNLAARYGPEEFVCVLGGCDEAGALTFAARVQERLRAAESTVALPTVSAGVAAYRPGLEKPEALLRAAEDALLQAKRDGGDRVRVYGRTTGELAQSEADRVQVEEARRTIAESLAQLAPAEPEPAEDGVEGTWAGAAALVLMTDAAARARLVKQLQAEELAVTEAANWLEALPQLRSNYFLAFMELTASAANGEEVVSELRARMPGIRVIGIARATSGSIDPALLSVRVDGYHLLSASGAQLRSQLREQLREAARHRAVLLRSRQLKEEVRAQVRETRVAVAASEARYRAVLQTIHQVIFTTDLAGNWTLLNPAWTSITGFNVEESLGRPLWETVAAEDRQALIDGFEQLMRRGGGHFRHEGRWRTRAGSYRWIEARLQLVLASTGEVRGTSGLLTDVTDRRAAEDALREKESQLAASQKMEAIGRLAGGVAHDFNNLLTAIRGHAALLLENWASNQPLARTDLLEIRDAAERASELTRQLLAFSRRQVLRPRVLDINLVIADLEPTLRRAAGEHNELVLEPAAPLDLVRADPAQIQQVIMNLVLNAREALPAGGRIVVRTANRSVADTTSSEQPEAAPGAYVMLEVEDNGTGMDEATAAQAFEPFFTTRQGASGLGLSTVYGIVKQSGGHVWLSSEPDRGTRVTVYLPRSEDTAEAGVPGTAQALNPGEETILLVEDEQSVRELARRILERKGYRVLAAGNAREALAMQAAYDGTIHLLVSDVVMPEMHGPELADRLADVRPGIRVLFMSGYAEEAIAQDGAFGPGREFIQKPFSPNELLGRVRAALDTRS